MPCAGLAMPQAGADSTSRRFLGDAFESIKVGHGQGRSRIEASPRGATPRAS